MLINQAQNVDTNPYIRHHPLIGYEYIPNTRYVLPRPGGGEYTMTINSAGIRSNREYSLKKDPHSYRILVFGDSMSAGQYVSNEHRFSELLERRLPGLEVINFSLEGTGTDQQLLLFEQVGKQYEYNLILLLPFLQNIRRNMVDFRIGMDPLTKEKVLTPKPRFELVNGELVLQNVPVPKERKPLRETNEEDWQRTDGDKGSWKKSLPYFKGLGSEAWRCFQEPYDCHFSVHGNLTLANALETELRKLKFLGR